jgi:hypothetical protein
MESNLFAMLEKRCGSREKASATLERFSLELGLSGAPQTYPLAALALIRLGQDSEKVASLLEWNDFEDLCAKLLTSFGYDVRRNVVLTKPRKQIDVFATSGLISLSVDCKHYAKGISPYSLARFAEDQLERTRLYKEKKGHKGPILPIIVTLVEPSALVVEGVPVVPMLKLRDFLQSVNPYDGLAVV